MIDSRGEFAKQVRSLRKEQGLSLRALAGLIGVSSVTVWKWENKDSKPRARLIAPLARALDISPGRLQASIKTGDTLREGVDVGLSRSVEPAALEQVEVTLSTWDEAGAGCRTEALADVIARAKQMIAEASGTIPNNITIRIEC